MGLAFSQRELRPADPAWEPTFARFTVWAEEYIQAAWPAAKQSLEKEGIRLARERRDDLIDLIQSDPERALELRIVVAVRKAMPPAIAGLLEQPVSGWGDLSVLAALAEAGRESQVTPIFRTAKIGGKSYRAFVYGRRLGEPTRRNIPLHGIALDNLIAVDENPVRIAEAEEGPEFKALASYPLCALCGQPTATSDEETVAEVGGEAVFLCSASHAEILNDQLIAKEANRYPADYATEAIQPASAWTEGVKRLLLIRVDFSDLSGIPFSDSTGIALISNLNLFYKESSYGKAGFALKGAGSDLTPTFRMPRTAAYYGANNYFDQLRSDARAAATAAGFKLSNFNLDLICFGNVPGWEWAGLGYVGAAGVWLRSSFDTGVAAHELGHNLGLLHANFWDTSGESVIGPGISIEYGDKFDTMGSAAAGQKHFNARYKNYLNWLTTSDVRTFTTNGIYQIYPHDLTNNLGVRALKIAKNSSTNYWIEFRQKYLSNKWLVSGVGLRWAQAGNQSTLLLDTTPGTLDGKDDSAIVFGRTFSDPQARIYITPLGTAATTPVSVRVMVNRGTFPTNLPPWLTLAASATNVAVSALVNLTSNASDVNGDTLAYSWDFGDRSFGTNSPTASHRWSAVGQYLVRCVVSDMKGGTASDSLVIRVGTPTTRLISGTVTAEGEPLAGVRVYVSSSQGTFTESDGTYTLVGLPNGNYSLNARLTGYAFIHPGFTNPIQLRADTRGMDFIAIPRSGQSTLTLVPAGAYWKYLDNGSNQGTAWSKPGFNDSLWKAGPAQLGYGDNDVTTKVGFGPNANQKYITTYFRHSFAVSNLAELAGLTLSVMRDDGAVVYLNGREVFRSNMPAGTIASGTLASVAVGGADESTFYDADVSPSFLVGGTNLLAVEIHQADPTSSDIGFDLRLIGITLSDTGPPVLSWEMAGPNLRLTWPATAVGWSLYSAPDPGPGTLWSPVPDAFPIANGLRTFTLVPTNSHQFFGLQKR